MLKLFLLLLAIFLFPLTTFSAEVLQINSFNQLLIGDNNRTYKVQIACIEVDPYKEDLALNWLREELPRNTRVNFKPQGSSEGMMVVDLIAVKTKKDIGRSMESEGFGQLRCSE